MDSRSGRADRKRVRSEKLPPPKRPRYDEKHSSDSESSGSLNLHGSVETTSTRGDTEKHDVGKAFSDRAREIIERGFNSTGGSADDVVLVVRPPKWRDFLNEYKEKTGQKPNSKRVDRKLLDTTFNREAVGKAAMKFCAAHMSQDLIGCARFTENNLNIPMSQKVLDKAVCCFLSYKTISAKNKASRALSTFECRIDEGFWLRLHIIPAQKIIIPPDEDVFVPFEAGIDEFARALSEAAAQDASSSGNSSDLSKDLDAFGFATPDRLASKAKQNPGHRIEREVITVENGFKSPPKLDGESESPEAHNEKREDKAFHSEHYIFDHGNCHRTEQGVLINLNVDSFAASDNIRLQNLPENERRLQARYWRITTDEDLVICPTCSKQGHMSITCPARTCEHCSDTGSHFSADCPSQMKCSRCRELGHDISRCGSKLACTSVDGYNCGLCHGGNHKEKNCSWVWRTFDPTTVRMEDLSTVYRMDESCYECGSLGHWGDDCLSRPKNDLNISTNDTFSAGFARQFLRNLSAVPLHQGKSNSSLEGRHKPRGSGSEQTEELLGDASTFIRTKINTSLAARPSIQVNTKNWNDASLSRLSTDNSAWQTDRHNGFKPINTYTNENNSTRNQGTYQYVPPPDQQRQKPRAIDQARKRHV